MRNDLTYLSISLLWKCKYISMFFNINWAWRGLVNAPIDWNIKPAWPQLINEWIVILSWWIYSHERIYTHQQVLLESLRCLQQGQFCVWPANERWRYNVTSSLIGWAHAHAGPCSSAAQMQDLDMVITVPADDLVLKNLKPSVTTMMTGSTNIRLGKILLPGPWFNIKMLSYQYRKSQCGDKTAVGSSYLHNGNFYTGMMVSLYRINALVASSH